MTTYRSVKAHDPRLQFTGVLVAGDASETTGAELMSLGSGFFIAPFLVLTARHVVDEVSAHFHGCLVHEIVGDMRFGIDFSIQHSRYGRMIWSVMAYGYTPTIDVVALWVELKVPSELPEDFTWDLPILSFSQAFVNQPVNALGFPHSTHRLDQHGRSIVGLDAHESSGIIAAIHKLKRDSVMLPYPCFEASVTTKGGMSGGPVFTSDGYVIGLVGSSMELGESGEPDVSFITAIWPVAGIQLRHTASVLGITKLDDDEETGEPAPGYPLQDLVDSGDVLSVHCSTSVDASGTVTVGVPCSWANAN